MRAVSFVLVGLLAGSVYGQSSSSSDPDTLRNNNSSSANPARNDNYDPATSPASTRSDRDPSSYDRSSSRSSMSERNASDDRDLKHGDKRFITKASESSQREIALSQLAATRATNPQVRSYAQQLVSGHQKMDQELMQLAQSKGVVLDDVAALSNSNISGSNSNSSTGASSTRPAVTAENSSSATRSSDATAANGDMAGRSNAVATNSEATSDRHYRSLAKKSGAEFDQEYVKMMIKEHKSDVKLFQKAASDAKDNDVRAFASRQLPALQAHLDQANSLGRIAAE